MVRVGSRQLQPGGGERAAESRDSANRVWSAIPALIGSFSLHTPSGQRAPAPPGHHHGPSPCPRGPDSIPSSSISCCGRKTTHNLPAQQLNMHNQVSLCSFWSPGFPPDDTDGEKRGEPCARDGEADDCQANAARLDTTGA